MFIETLSDIALKDSASKSEWNFCKTSIRFSVFKPSIIFVSDKGGSPPSDYSIV